MVWERTRRQHFSSLTPRPRWWSPADSSRSSGRRLGGRAGRRLLPSGTPPLWKWWGTGTPHAPADTDKQTVPFISSCRRSTEHWVSIGGKWNETKSNCLVTHVQVWINEAQSSAALIYYYISYCFIFKVWSCSNFTLKATQTVACGQRQPRETRRRTERITASMLTEPQTNALLNLNEGRSWRRLWLWFRPLCRTMEDQKN